MQTPWLRHGPTLRRFIIPCDGLVRQQYGRDETETLVPHGVVDPDDHCQLDGHTFPPDGRGDQNADLATPLDYAHIGAEIPRHRQCYYRHRQCRFLSRALAVEKVGGFSDTSEQISLPRSSALRLAGLGCPALN